ncbi:L-amino acid N-acyltransferase YncA [Albimonas donghaensis]|uniref:L-amino acid N-acyltransferase YncA n=1 Tax=Albimonas donghaensis TaxID=356660 RepID=A0A1H2WLE9_9RHOB|nr:GNAT family N-acetyltransferase [Albimonas donghaensis]SDW81470.1 L-amino acid N-acyltransferase YncA [Albimonas donghaensis]
MSARPDTRPAWTLRLARAADIPAMTAVMDRAIGRLLDGFLTPQQVADSVAIMGMDPQLVADGTYFLVEDASGAVIGCGGWSKRRTSHGGGHSAGRDDALVDPATEPARVRAMYTDPDHARRGIGRAILAAAEAAAAEAGFSQGMLIATLAGAPLYRAAGWREVERMEAPAVAGRTVPVLRMVKTLG